MYGTFVVFFLYSLHTSVMSTNPPSSSVLYHPIPVGRSIEVNTTVLKGLDVKYENYIGRLVPSPYTLYPSLCTAICIEERIFFVPYQCVAGTHRSFRQLRLCYKYKVIQLEALILPDPATHTYAYRDDIAFVITKSEKREVGFFEPVALHEPLERPENDEYFSWFEAKWQQNTFNWKVLIIGFIDKDINYDTISLSELYTHTRWPSYETEIRFQNIILGVDICDGVILRNSITPNAPCGLTSEDTYNNKNTLLALGAGVFYDNKLIGVACWTVRDLPKVPIGICTPNSKEFLSSYHCAKLIRNASKSSSIGDDDPVSYQKLCNQ